MQPDISPVATELGELLARAVDHAVERAVARIEAALRPSPPAHLSIRDTAREMGISTRSVHRLIRAKRLPASRLATGGSSRVLIARADVERLLRENAVGGAQ